MPRRLAPVLLALAVVVPTADAVAAKGQRKPLPPRLGGPVREAWPESGRGKPGSPLARLLAQQAGPEAVRAPKRRRTRARAAAATAPAVAFTTKGGDPLQLVRSYDIPPADPAYSRFINLSWTYDSALAAAAFVAAGEKQQAEQLLDQLAALQRADGSLEYAYDVHSGAGAPLFRSGTMAWVGFAATNYMKAHPGGTRYDVLADGTARWLAAQEIPAGRPGAGLLRGGPDVEWASALHNLVAYFFLRDWSVESELRLEAPISDFTPADAGALAERIAIGIERDLLVLDNTDAAYVRQGLGDDALVADAQALAIPFLLDRRRTADAQRVAVGIERRFPLRGGVRPEPGIDAVWGEGTAETRAAFALLDRKPSFLAPITTLSALPPASDREVRNELELKTWPASAPGSWLLLSQGRLERAFQARGRGWGTEDR